MSKIIELNFLLSIFEEAAGGYTYNHPVRAWLSNVKEIVQAHEAGLRQGKSKEKTTIVEIPKNIIKLLKEAEKALEPFGNEANAWDEMGSTRPIMGPDSVLTVGHLEEARRVLLAVRQYMAQRK